MATQTVRHSRPASARSSPEGRSSLPTFLREYDKLARLCAAEGLRSYPLSACAWPLCCLGCIAVRFHWASDLANTPVQGRNTDGPVRPRTDDSATADCEAGVVALKTRSIAPVGSGRTVARCPELAESPRMPPISIQILLDIRSTLEANIGPVASPARCGLRRPSPWLPVFRPLAGRCSLGHLSSRTAC